MSFENCAQIKRSSRNFSRPQVIENSRQHLLLRTDILQKTVVGCKTNQFSKGRMFKFKRNYNKLLQRDNRLK